MREVVLDVFHKWLWIEDDVPLDIVVTTALASMFPGDPVWLLLVGSPGGGKTEMVRALQGSHTYHLDTLTSKTLVSGLKEKGKPDRFGILQDLDGKLLIIKDLTVMLQGPDAIHTDDSVFTQLRAIYDGEYAAAHGSGHKRQYYKSTFGLIAAVTPIVDRFRSLHSALGERFLTIRLNQIDNSKAIQRAQENSGKEKRMRQELGDTMNLVLEHYMSIATSVGIPMLSDEDSEKVRALGDITAKLRTELIRDRMRNVVALPGVEVGTRLVKQLTRMGEMLLLYGAYDYKTLTRLARDCISPMKLQVIQGLVKLYKANANELRAECPLSYNTIKEACEDLWLLKFCDKEELGKASNYSFKPEITESILKSELLD